MAGTVTIHPSRRLIYARVFGATSREDILATRQLAAHTPHFDPAFDIIVDLRDANLSGLSADDVGALGTTSVINNAARRVLVTDRADQFGMARMYETLRDLEGFGAGVYVARSIEDALRWLGLEAFDPTIASPD